MARSLSTAVMRGLARSRVAASTSERAGTWPTIKQFINYSSGLDSASDANGSSSATHVAVDPDTHQDFQPTSKSLDMSLDEIIDKDIKENPVVIYMKGSPDAPRCGFSALAVKVLKLYEAPITSRDILKDLSLKESVKAHTKWPTFPQIFIKGEFIGGSDILLQMHQRDPDALKNLLGTEEKGEKDGDS